MTGAPSAVDEGDRYLNSVTKPSSPDIVRSIPPSEPQTYGVHLERLRDDFYFKCAYCGRAEFEAIGRVYEIDHYKPQSVCDAEGVFAHNYTNLYYCCDTCNQIKGDVWPTPEQWAIGHYVLRNDIECFTDHIKEEDIDLVPITRAGYVTIELFALNGPALVRMRRQRAEFGFERGRVLRGLHALLDRKIDQIPPPLRAQIDKVARKLTDQAINLDEIVTLSLLKAFNRSEEFDKDAIAKKAQNSIKQVLFARPAKKMAAKSKHKKKK